MTSLLNRFERFFFFTDNYGTANLTRIADYFNCGMVFEKVCATFLNLFQPFEKDYRGFSTRSAEKGEPARWRFDEFGKVSLYKTLDRSNIARPFIRPN